MKAFEIVGVAELAAAAGQPANRVRLWRHRGQVPLPDAELACGPIWRMATVERWIVHVRAGLRPSALGDAICPSCGGDVFRVREGNTSTRGWRVYACTARGCGFTTVDPKEVAA